MLLLKHTIENLTNNGELDTSDGQRLLITSSSLEKWAKSNLSDLKDCDCGKEKYEFCSVKQNTVEEFNFECSRCGEKFSLKSDTSVVKATNGVQGLQYVISLLFHSLSVGSISKIKLIIKFSDLSVLTHPVRRLLSDSRPLFQQQLSYCPLCQEWENYRLSDLAI